MFICSTTSPYPAIQKIMKTFPILVTSIGLTVLSFVYVVGNNSNNLEVSFLNVGQGDAIFIKTPNDIQILIDGGPDSRVVEKLDKQMPFLDRTIDIVIATHPDLDHIGGLTDVLQKYDVNLFLTSGNEGSNEAWESIERILKDRNIKTEITARGDVYDFNDGVLLKILFPYKDVKDVEANESSLVTQITYNKQSFLLTGDAPIQTEFILIGADGITLQSTVLKLGHHGSNTSTAEYFLEKVNPTFTVISAGKDNRYGHPHKSVTDLLDKYDIQVFETAKHGTIQFSTNGETIEVTN